MNIGSAGGDNRRAAPCTRWDFRIAKNANGFYVKKQKLCNQATQNATREIFISLYSGVKSSNEEDQKKQKHDNGHSQPLRGYDNIIMEGWFAFQANRRRAQRNHGLPPCIVAFSDGSFQWLIDLMSRHPKAMVQLSLLGYQHI